MYTKMIRDLEVLVIKKDDNKFIPLDENNSDYQEYLAWLSIPNIPNEEEF